MLTVEKALQQILLECCNNQDQVELPLLEARGKVVAVDVISTVDVPEFNNSAMDGYALCSTDLKSANNLPISTVIPAGSAPKKLKAGTAARIFTGAPIPDGADAVEMQENTTADELSVTFKQSVISGANIRLAGEDIEKGAVVLKKGSVLDASKIGLLASVGVGVVTVFKTLKVAVVSSGDELVEPGVGLEPGQIYNSNRYLLQALMLDAGYEVIDGGVMPDDFSETRRILTSLADTVDVVISTGGVSVGELDFVKSAVEQSGRLALWKIAVKPGKPVAFGNLGDTTFFGLPGNPVSAFVTWHLFVRPWLYKASGRQGEHNAQYRLKAAFHWPRNGKPGKREEYLRAKILPDSERVEIYPRQGSGVLSSVAWGDGLVVVKAGDVIQPDDQVLFLPY